MPGVQNTYKDRLFSFIFGNEEHREWTLSLYNAVNGTHYEDASQIVITTIKEALYLGMHNDVSFMISNEMNMYEQQSTYNPNMPLRMLQYTGSLYEKNVTARGKNKYGRTIVDLPVPKLVVFYNGRKDEPDETTLYLRDAFPKELRDDADIQVRVRMVNVNKGRNGRLMAACKPLTEYAWIVDKIRELEPEAGLEAAIGMAIDAMPRNFVTRPLLEAHKAEVKDMLLTEYDEAKAMELFRMEGKEEGKVQLGTLIAKLLLLGRTDDALRASTDPVYREQLIAEYQIT